MGKRLFVSVLIGFVAMAGCRKVEDTTSAMQTSAPRPISATPTAAFPPTLPSSPIASPALLALPSPTATLRFPPETEMVFRCTERLSAIPDDFSSTGVVVLDSREVTEEGRSTGDVFLLSMADMTTTLLSGEERFARHITVSLNKTWMAYKNVRTKSLDIATVNGQIVQSIPWDDGWVGIPGWLNDERLILNISGLDPLEDTLRKPAHLLALNPFTGARTVLSPDFPDIHTSDMFDWAGWSRTMYDPTLTRVVYLTEYDDFSYVLWDLENEREITRLPARIPMWNYIPIPRWYSDGSKFAIEAWIPEEERLELFVVSRNGEDAQLTHLYSSGEATLAQYSWSPDGRYLAGLLDTSLGSAPWLEFVVLDTETTEITDYCLRIRYFGNASRPEDSFPGSPPFPIWSPDGTQVLLNNRTDEGDWQVLLVDVSQGTTGLLAEGAEAVGWMISPDE